jgi:hypothetical protein
MKRRGRGGRVGRRCRNLGTRTRGFMFVMGRSRETGSGTGSEDESAMGWGE